MALDLKSDDWGGSTTIAGRSFSLRLLVGFGGIVLWLGIMLLRTGGAGLHSLATTVQFLVTILIISAATASITLRPLLSMFLAGGFVMGILAVVGRLFGFGAGGISTNFLVAIVEEAAILAPPMFLLWRWRNGRLWSLGATDVFLLFAACGAGFALVETAYILNARSLDQLSWFPVVAWDGDRIRGYHPFNGHEIWASLAGQAIGLSLLLRNKTNLAWLIALGAIAIGTIDHFLLDTRLSDFPLNVLRVFTGDGYLVLLLFVVGLFSTLMFDAQIIYRLLPKYLLSLVKQPIWSAEGISSLRQVRALAFSNFQVENAPEKDEPKVASICANLTNRLLSRFSVTE